MIERLVNSGAMPVLERLVQFTNVRHQRLTHNIANLSTPYFRPTDLDPEAFQAELREAIDRRREGSGSRRGPLEMRDTRQLRFTDEGVEVRPRPRNQNVLFHDRNNRDLERIMQDLAENTMTHNAAVELMRSEFEIIRVAIRERV